MLKRYILNANHRSQTTHEDYEDFQIWLIWPNQVTGGDLRPQHCTTGTDTTYVIQRVQVLLTSRHLGSKGHIIININMEKGDTEKEKPSLILLFSGKRKSGKDFVTDLLQVSWSVNRERNLLDAYCQEHLGSGCVILRLSGPLKECYAREHGLDFEKMLSASDYKEKYTKHI